MRRVEPTAASHIFLVYGEACFRDEAHPKCTHTEAGQRPQGKLFSLDLEHLLGNEWQVCSTGARGCVAMSCKCVSSQLLRYELGLMPCWELLFGNEPQMCC